MTVQFIQHEILFEKNVLPSSYTGPKAYTFCFNFGCFILQLYELGTEPERKEFLDDLFTFMQKRGKMNIIFAVKDGLFDMIIRRHNLTCTGKLKL